MAFTRIRNGRYLYREERKRVNGKVKSISTYLGIVGDTTDNTADDWAEKRRKWDKQQDRYYDAAMRQAEKSRLAAQEKAPAPESKGMTDNPAADKSVGSDSANISTPDASLDRAGS